MTRIVIPPPLHSYTGGISGFECEETTLSEALARLEERFPGIRFRIVDEQDRIRPHIQFFVGGRLARDLSSAVAPGAEIQIVCALSGG